MGGFIWFNVGIVIIGSATKNQRQGYVNIVDGVFIMETNEDKKGLGYDTNHFEVIEVRTALKWLPLMPPRAFSTVEVAHKVIEDITGKDHEEVLFCDNPEYRITRYSSVKTNEL